DMNTVVLNDKTTQVGNCHREKIGEDQHIEVHQNRQKTVGGIETQKIGQNKIEYVKGDYQHFSHLDTLLSSAEGNIIFETAGGKVTLTQDGKITILAKKIIINGQPVKINCGNENVDISELISALSENSKWLAFQYFDSYKKPLKNLSYTVYFENGEQYKGKLDNQGVCYIENPASEIVDIEIHNEIIPKREDVSAYLNRFFSKKENIKNVV
ncbi:bacteriophage T4 gp5 trimerisation domain-containing protein, partial [Rodentibacter rarus]